MQIIVETLENKILSFQVDPSDYVENLKEKIHAMVGVDPNELKLLYAGEWLINGRCLRDYNVQEGGIFQIVVSVKGGGDMGYKFVDITDKTKGIKRDWSFNAPKWRIASPGLYLEGECLNMTCEAFEEKVVVNKGMGTYDVLMDQHQNKCPICQEYVMTKQCGFNNCIYTYEGIVISYNGKPPKPVKGEEEEVGDYYLYFDPDVAGELVWSQLKIITKRL